MRFGPRRFRDLGFGRRGIVPPEQLVRRTTIGIALTTLLPVAALLAGTTGPQGGAHRQRVVQSAAGIGVPDRPPPERAGRGRTRRRALAGPTRIDLSTEPLGVDAAGKPVHLREIWPSTEEIAELVAQVSPEMFRREYADVFSGDETWRALPIPELAAAGTIYAYSFILTSLDVSTPGKAAAAEHWYRHRTTIENIFRDSKHGAALRHLGRRGRARRGPVGRAARCPGPPSGRA